MEGTHMTQPKRTNRFADEVRLAATLTPAVPKVVPVSRTTASADSSGFVDLTDFSETDGDWVDRALAQARGGGRAVPPSIAPVAMESLAEPTAKRRESSPLAAIVFVAACVAVAAAGVASAVLVLRARNEKVETATAAIAPMTITPPSASAAPSVDASPPSASTADSAPSTIAARPSRTPTKKPSVGASHPQATYATPSRASGAPAAKRPASGAGGGSGGSLDDLIRRAAQGKGGH
jgi:hypothetical protein